MTKEEKLKAMATDEFAEMIDAGVRTCRDCPAKRFCGDERKKYTQKPCKAIIAEWLVQPEGTS